MTPQREQYLAKCSNREKYLRKEIKDYKREIRVIKSSLQAGCDIELNLSCLKFRKLWLTMARHELHRLKGMDRVVVPKISYSSDDDFSVPIFECSCGMILCGTSCCERCGKRILWEKVNMNKWAF